MRTTLCLVFLLGSLAGCGRHQPDRVTGGAATGAGTGATIGLIGGPIGVAAGALIGGGVGAVTGAVVSPSHVNLGPPLWSNHTQ
ncbi:hypothetical protein [Rhodopila globiformis]|uniref:Bacteriocin n=1 Tax=Rhodopila globiformis TaxID=1071 RepID=A0A2S6NLS3_RHOGL|nr:hypothetical protein [Rhodopila globiformis]PPQ36247.1 hypothetical protein CCS01_05440 [Rhodopila globiformis]